MLPGPGNGYFWEQVAEINGTSVGYVYEKMSTAANFVRQPVLNDQGWDVTYFCTYVIMFFGGDKPELWALIARELAALGDEYGHFGALFARDFVDTAWRLWAHYTPVDTDRPASWFDARPPS